MIQSNMRQAVEIDGTTYEIDALRAPGECAALSVSRAGAELVVERLDLRALRERERVAQVVGKRLRLDPGAVAGALVVLLDQAEREADADQKLEPVLLPEGRRRAAERLLEQRNLLDRVAEAFDALGYVGDSRAKKLVFLVAVSRLMARPLSAILSASSGTGKTLLLEMLFAILPPAVVVFLARITRHALYYSTPGQLAHKVVMVDETDGVQDADYAVRTLQTAGVLRLAHAVGGITETAETRGPISLICGTTRLAQLNDENVNRCVTIPLDETPEQTRAIHDAQRRLAAGASTPPTSIQAWQDVHLALESLDVVIPFAELIRFPVRHARDRRELPKFLGLIQSCALLHQRQRARDASGRVVATPDDYRGVYDLVGDLVAGSTNNDEMSTRSTTLMAALSKQPRETTFTRADAARLSGLSDSTVVRALDELVSKKLVAELSNSSRRTYRLLDLAVSPDDALSHPDEIDTAAARLEATQPPLTTVRRARGGPASARLGEREPA